MGLAPIAPCGGYGTFGPRGMYAAGMPIAGM